MKDIFLEAEWRKLAMANYVIDPAILKAFVPNGTELDYFNGQCYVSLVGFMFLNTRVKGLAVPFHRHFEEVNLRFYVRHCTKQGEWRRGVVFIKEIVPKPLLTWTANLLYGEHYQTLPMEHEWTQNEENLTVAYRWKSKTWNSLALTAENIPLEIQKGSEEEFIAEHYWGYTRLSESITSEYRVAHPKWQIYPVKACNVDVDFAGLYGNFFSGLGQVKPVSALLAEGSDIEVHKGIRF